MQERGRLHVDGADYETEIPDRAAGSWKGAPDRTRIRAFIPGTIVEVKAKAGDRVGPGSVLLLLDAMKMYNEVCAEIPARVRSVLVTVGDTVQKDQLMIELDALRTGSS